MAERKTQDERGGRVGAEEVAEGRGRAKLILFGEHAVVYGKPAVAAGLALGARASARFAGSSHSQHQLRLRGALAGADVFQVRVDVVSGADSVDADAEPLARAFSALVAPFDLPEAVDVDVTMEIPVGVGLGSSAALAVAGARALGALVGRPERVDAAVSASESVFHGNPSGLDQRIASADAGLYFCARTHDGSMEVAPIEAAPLTLAVCQAGPAASTAQMVEQVRQLHGREPQLVGYLHQLIGDVSRAASAALPAADWVRVGELMNINHGALVALGVSTPALDAACHVARAAGALGAKLTGAGGGGCVLALTPDGAQPVLDAWAREGLQGFEVFVSAEDGAQ